VDASAFRATKRLWGLAAARAGILTRLSNT
jgi:hypothetical protein